MECPKCGLDVLADGGQHLNPETLKVCDGKEPVKKTDEKEAPKKAK